MQQKEFQEGSLQHYKPTLGKISSKQPKFMPKETRERRTDKTQTQQKERNHKDQSRINEIEAKKTIEKMNETKRCFVEKINTINKPLARLKEKRGLRSVRSEMKKKLQRTSH